MRLGFALVFASFVGARPHGCLAEGSEAAAALPGDPVFSTDPDASPCKRVKCPVDPTGASTVAVEFENVKDRSAPYLKDACLVNRQTGAAVPPGKVAPGSYTVYAGFPDLAVAPVATLALAPGDAATVLCDEQTRRCEQKGPGNR